MTTSDMRKVYEGLKRKVSGECSHGRLPRQLWLALAVSQGEVPSGARAEVSVSYVYINFRLLS